MNSLNNSNIVFNNTIPYLNDDVMINHILSKCSIEELSKVAQVSKRWRQLSMSDIIWQPLARKKCENEMGSIQLQLFANALGWKSTFKFWHDSINMLDNMRISSSTRL